MDNKLLEIKDLVINFEMREETVYAVNGISFSLDKGETLGLVGETGAGKTTTALGILNLVQTPPGVIKRGEILLNGENLLTKSKKELSKIRGGMISMIFQDPMTALNPVMTVGDQIMEVVLLHNKMSKAEAARYAQDMLELVGISRERYSEYPHQFSGGMKQRVIIAIALACNPKLLIADEPTTALDVTIQAQVLELINNLKQKLDTSVILITHDLGIVAETCDKVAIMYAGQIVEWGTAEEIYNHHKHPYTTGLFGAVPNLDEDIDRLQTIAGAVPDPTNLPTGCTFHPRCPKCTQECKIQDPEMKSINENHSVKCIHCNG